MKRWLLTAAAIFGLSGSVAFTAAPARANNENVNAALATYSDISVFYAALLNTGVLNELDPNMQYTIFAPTNEAFAEIQPNLYPCFYSAQCRPQVAAVLRDHIVIGDRTLSELANETEIPTVGGYRLYAESPYVGDYSIADRKVLSGAELRGNMVYRINGVIMTNQQLAQFRALPPIANLVSQQKTITTYRTSNAYPVPGGGYPVNAAETMTETYVVPATPPMTTVVYPGGTQTTTYVTPDGSEATTVTRAITPQP